MLDLDHPSLAHGRGQPYLIQAGRSVEEVHRAAHVRAAVHPHGQRETLQSSPRPVSSTHCSTIGGLSGQCGMPCRTVTETSIHPITSA
jgi:hypothetical protein